jgi:hypothetical protein
MNKTKHYSVFFKNDVFYLVDYTNGIAHFRTEVVEEGFLCYYDIICTVHDDFLEELEETDYKDFYTIKEIYCRAEYISEINQHNVFSVKADVLFSNVERQNEKEI